MMQSSCKPNAEASSLDYAEVQLIFAFAKI